MYTYSSVHACNKRWICARVFIRTRSHGRVHTQARYTQSICACMYHTRTGQAQTCPTQWMCTHILIHVRIHVYAHTRTQPRKFDSTQVFTVVLTECYEVKRWFRSLCEKLLNWRRLVIIWSTKALSLAHYGDTTVSMCSKSLCGVNSWHHDLNLSKWNITHDNILTLSATDVINVIG